MGHVEYDLADRFTADSGVAFLSGLQALARIPIGLRYVTLPVPDARAVRVLGRNQSSARRSVRGWRSSRDLSRTIFVSGRITIAIDVRDRFQTGARNPSSRHQTSTRHPLVVCPDAP
jgi:hypothetical protein